VWVVAVVAVVAVAAVITMVAVIAVVEMAAVARARAARGTALNPCTGLLALIGLVCVGIVVLSRFTPSTLSGLLWSRDHAREDMLLTLNHSEEISGNLSITTTILWVYDVILAVLVIGCTCGLTPGTWTGVDPEPISGAELEALRAEVRAASLRQKQKYNFGVEVRAAFRVARGGAAEARFKTKRATLRQRGKPDDDCRLYHGTSARSARAIITGGFRLPTHKGMFGAGVYFSDCPLKSLQYVRLGGVMLACDVVLGYSKRMKLAHHELSPSKDLKRGLVPRLFGARSFDSVTAESGNAGCVRVPEMVVYDPAQAVPRYVMLVREVE